jgi:hypothetical protein
MGAADVMMSTRRCDVGLTAEQVAVNRAKAANNALPVLIDRAGGSVTICRADFEEVGRYGGASRMAIQMESIGAGDAIRLTLVRKEPAQGDVPV